MFMHQKPVSFNSTFKGTFWGANGHLNLSNGTGKDQIALLVLLIPH